MSEPSKTLTVIVGAAVIAGGVVVAVALVLGFAQLARFIFGL